MCTCVIGRQLPPPQTVHDVANSDGGVQLGVVRHLWLFDVSAVAHGVDVGETLNLQVLVDLQSAAGGHAGGCERKHTSLCLLLSDL